MTVTCRVFDFVSSNGVLSLKESAVEDKVFYIERLLRLSTFLNMSVISLIWYFYKSCIHYLKWNKNKVDGSITEFWMGIWNSVNVSDVNKLFSLRSKHFYSIIKYK